ncbi:hypothetical protein HOP61_21745, partial [Halomonas daqingensis]|nr:hypothetical protein [Halomonas desiderata]
SIVEVTQQNAALVEEATAASHSLSDQARELARLVQRFKIEVSMAIRTDPPAVISFDPPMIVS